MKNFSLINEMFHFYFHLIENKNILFVFHSRINYLRNDRIFSAFLFAMLHKFNTILNLQHSLILNKKKMTHLYSNKKLVM